MCVSLEVFLFGVQQSMTKETWGEWGGGGILVKIKVHVLKNVNQTSLLFKITNMRTCSGPLVTSCVVLRVCYVSFFNEFELSW